MSALPYIIYSSRGISKRIKNHFTSYQSSFVTKARHFKVDPENQRTQPAWRCALGWLASACLASSPRRTSGQIGHWAQRLRPSISAIQAKTESRPLSSSCQKSVHYRNDMHWVILCFHHLGTAHCLVRRGKLPRQQLEWTCLVATVQGVQRDHDDPEGFG